MKSKTITAPRPLDLDTLSRVNGGCQLVVVPQAPTQTQTAHTDPGFAFAAADAWSSLASMGSSFTMDHHAANFMRADVAEHQASQDAAPAPMHVTSHSPDSPANQEAPSASDESNHSDAPEAPHAPIALHCGTTTPTSTR